MRTPQVLLGVLRCAGPDEWESVPVNTFPEVVVQLQNLDVWGASPFPGEVAHALLFSPFEMHEAREILGRMKAFHQFVAGSVFECVDPDIVLRVRQAVIERPALYKNLKHLLYKQDFSYESAKALLSAAQRLIVESENGYCDPVHQYLPWLTDQASQALTGLSEKSCALLRFLFVWDTK